MELIFWLIIIIIIVAFIFVNVRIVPQATTYVIERLGSFHTVWGNGLHLKIPFADRISKVVSLKEQVVDFPPQPVITKDNATIQIDTVLFYQITDSKLYTYGAENPITAIEKLAVTTLRNIIGALELDQTLTSRDTINNKMRAILDEATDPWGIKLNRVELKNILPPREIQDSMEKQMKAERDKRATIINAEADQDAAILVANGRKQAAILNAEGLKASVVLSAEAEKSAAVLKAEAEKISAILAAEGSQQAQILMAEGEAQAILKVQNATAEGIKMINESHPSNAVIAIRGMEAFQKAADGRATKIIIPSNLQGLAGLVTSAAELAAGSGVTEA